MCRVRRAATADGDHSIVVDLALFVPRSRVELLLVEVLPLLAMLSMIGVHRLGGDEHVVKLGLVGVDVGSHGSEFTDYQPPNSVAVAIGGQHWTSVVGSHAG